jgi:tetratricopeptide (TPR) repeat protein
MGMVAQLRGDLDAAEEWYRRSLTIFEQRGDRPGMADTYHNLGSIAGDRGDLDAAEDWYRHSLSIEEQLGNRSGMAISYGALGLLRAQRGDPQGALEWTVRCMTVFADPRPSTGPALPQLARLTEQLGEPALERTWMKVTGQPLPDNVRAYVRAQQDTEEGEE